jgi:hypothetical protein
MTGRLGRRIAGWVALVGELDEVVARARPARRGTRRRTRQRRSTPGYRTPRSRRRSRRDRHGRARRLGREPRARRPARRDRRRRARRPRPGPRGGTSRNTGALDDRDSVEVARRDPAVKAQPEYIVDRDAYLEIRGSGGRKGAQPRRREHRHLRSRPRSGGPAGASCWSARAEG